MPRPRRLLRAFGVARAAALAGVMAVAATGLTGCKVGVSSGDVLRIGTSSGIDSLNPFVGINQDAFSVWMQMYPTLLQYDTTKPAHPYLPSFATSYDVSNGGRRFLFHTQPHATWSDGQPMTAQDAAWSLNLMHRLRNGAAGNWGLSSDIRTIKAPNRDTLVIVYRTPRATALYDLGTTPLLPPQAWRRYAAGDGKALKQVTNAPTDGHPVVSGGPFELVSYTKNDIALFKRNPDWYGPTPHIEGFGLQTYQSEDAMVTALKNDELDAINEVPPTSVATLRRSGLGIARRSGLALRDLIINTNPKKKDHPELLDPQVRKALEYAVDRKAIVDTAWLGHASPGGSIIPPATASDGQLWHDASIKPLPFDPAAANKILDGLGFRRGSGGVRVADGVPMRYNLVFADDESGAGDRAFQIIQNGFARIGVEVTQQKLDSSAAFDAIYCGDDCAYQKFDLAMWDWFPAVDPDFMLQAMTCKQWGGWNDSGYCNHRYDALHQEQQEAVDVSQRKRIIDRMQQMVYRDRPYVILTYDQRLDAWATSWRGLVESPQGFFNNWSTQSLERAEPR